MQQHPKMAEAQVGLSQALLAQNKATEAVAEARKATETDPKSGEAFAALGTAILAENSKNWNDAIAQAQQGAFVSPASPVVQVAVGHIFEAGGNLDQAVSSYKRALEADPGYVPARAALVQLQVRRGETDAALPEAQKLAAEAPDSGEAKLIPTPGYKDAAGYANLGYAYRTMKPPRTEDAIAAYKKAMDIDPKNEQVALGLARSLFNANRFDEAIEMYKKTIQLEPSYAGEANLGIAWSYTFKKDLAQARAVLDKAKSELPAGDPRVPQVAENIVK